MKKSLLLLLLVVSVFAFAGCGSKSDDTNGAKENTGVETSEEDFKERYDAILEKLNDLTVSAS